MIPTHMFDEEHGAKLEDMNWGGFYYNHVIDDMYEKMNGRVPKYKGDTHFSGLYGLLNMCTTDLFECRTRTDLIEKSCGVGPLD